MIRVPGMNWIMGRLSSRLVRPVTDEEFARERRRLMENAPPPGIWLFGKAQSGKSTIVRYLTGSDNATVGRGFKPETARTEEYPFPSDETPLVRFFDTRGLGEASYDPSEDLKQLGEKTHLVIVTVRLTDFALDSILEPLRRLRSDYPERPILLALTCLHRAYPPGAEHPDPDPWGPNGDLNAVPDEARRLLAIRREQFGGLVDRVEPIDITRKEEGFRQFEFGGERLKRALIELLPASFAATFQRLDELIAPLQDLHERRATPYIHGYALMAASAAAVPFPWLDIPLVVGAQARLIHEIGRVYHQEFGVDQILSMAGAFGGRLVLRQGVRELLKAIPFVGVAANAALAYATTFGLGKAACWYFGRRLAGRVPSTKEFQEVLAKQTRLAESLWRSNHSRSDSP